MDTSIAYNVSLNKIENKEDELQWSEYDNSEEMNKESAISKAKEFISKYADTNDFWIVTVEEGTIDWDYNQSNFGNGNYIFAITNKDEKVTLNLLGNSATYEYGDIEFLR